MRKKRSVVAAVLGMLAAVCMTVLVTSPAGADSVQADRGTQPPAEPEGKTKTIRYGPFELGAGGHMGNTPLLFIETPCGDCYITGMVPNLVYPDGSTANVNTGPMLHHVVFFNMFQRDPVCGTSVNAAALLGERFAASGNERTKIISPEGYGYYNPSFHVWSMIIELMNHSHEPKTVYLEMEWTYLPGSADVKPVQPVWLSVAGCYIYDTFEIPAGRSETSWEWDVNVPGKIVGMGGHLHNSGVRLTATNVSTGDELCTSEARYGESPEFIDHHGKEYISTMTRCYGSGSDPIGVLESGQTVRLTAVYDSKKPRDDVMGIMVTYIAPEGTK